MACSSCGNSSGSTSVPCSSCGQTSPCRRPKRSCAKPVLNVCKEWVGRLLGWDQGKLILKNGDCVGYLKDEVSGPVKYDAAADLVYVGSDAVPDKYGCERPEDQPSGFPIYGVTPECLSPGESPDREIAPIRPFPSDTGIPLGHIKTCACPGLEQELRPVDIIPAEQVACPEPGFRRWKTKFVPKSITNPCGPTMEHILEKGLYFDDDEIVPTGAVTDDKDTDTGNDRMMFGAVVKSPCPQGGWEFRPVPMAYFKEFVLSLIPSNPDAPPTPDEVFKFHYTGAQQVFTVPVGAKFLDMWIWGAGGCGDGSNTTFPPYPNAGRGGFGGLTTLTMAAPASGTQLSVIVGRGATDWNTEKVQGLGFGGLGSSDSHQHGGGGLSGVFSGSSNVLATDTARAIAVAGGGGAGGATGVGQNMVKGGNGNDGSSGGMPNMHGANATNGNPGLGGGGGGFSGGASLGLAGRGGSGYVKPGIATTYQIMSAQAGDLLPPGTTESYYADSQNAAMHEKHGFVVIRVRF